MPPKEVLFLRPRTRPRKEDRLSAFKLRCEEREGREAECKSRLEVGEGVKEGETDSMDEAAEGRRLDRSGRAGSGLEGDEPRGRRANDRCSISSSCSSSTVSIVRDAFLETLIPISSPSGALLSRYGSSPSSPSRCSRPSGIRLSLPRAVEGGGKEGGRGKADGEMMRDSLEEEADWE